MLLSVATVGVVQQRRLRVDREQPGDAGEAVAVRALVSVGRVGAKRHQGVAHVMTGDDRGVGIGVVVAKDIGLASDAVAAAQAPQIPRQVTVEWPAGVLGAQRNPGFPRVLARRDGSDVDADKLRNALIQGRAGAGAHRLGDT